MVRAVQVSAAAQALANELNACLVQTGGLSCELVQSMTSTTVTTAERQPSVVNSLTADPQEYSIRLKNNVERFVFEFLTNRTFVGQPHDLKDENGEPVGCDTLQYRCSAGEVCTCCA